MIGKKILAMLVVIAITGMIMGTAHALTVTINKDLTCGDRNWGERSFPINNRRNSVAFGSGSDCSHTSQYLGKYNTAVITTSLMGYPARYDTSWQTIFQGTTPWNENAARHGGATYDNPAFPLASEQSRDYQLRTQWVWTQDESPNQSGRDVTANYLTNLWFIWDRPGTNADYLLVIDFMWDRLEERGRTGMWQQDPVRDASPYPGVQYYKPYCDSPSHDTIYHYNVVLDNTHTSAGRWNEKTINIDRYIEDAFSQVYEMQSGCRDNTPGSRSDFVIADFESGIEVQALRPGATGIAKGAYSFSELWY